MNEINVYCDNQRLKELILETKPSKTGLFPHEIAMLFYTSHGTYSTRQIKFSSTFQYEFYVDYPELLFESLIERKYIRLCRNDELIDCLKFAELRKVLKDKKIKVGKVTKENVKKLIVQNFTSDELAELCENRYYVLSDKGRMELEINKKYTDSILAIWRDFVGDKEMDYLKEEDVKIKNNTSCILEISSIDFNGKLLMEPLKVEEKLTRYYKKFTNTVSMEIRYDGDLVNRIDRVISCYLLKKKELIIVNCEYKNEKVKSIWIDLNSKKQIFSEKVPIREFCNIGSGYYKELCKDEDLIKGIVDEENIYYYIHIRDFIAEAVIMNYFADKIEIKELPNILKCDESENYIIKVKKNDIETQRVITHMLERRYIVEPTLRGIFVSDIVKTMLKASDYKTLQQIIENELLMNNLKTEVINAIRREISMDIMEVIEVFLEVFPPRIIFKIHPYDFSFDNRSRKYDNWKYVVANRNSFEKKYKDIIKQLMDEKVISVRWKNEFELYYIVKKYFNDTIFQYRCEWLEQQSLDIYIPSCNVAIEYQGKQHYEPIGFFGGEEAFINNKERDIRKMAKCEEHNVKIIYWHYEKLVNEKNVLEMLSENKLNYNNG